MKNKVKRLSVWLVCVLAAVTVFACGKKNSAPAYEFGDYTYVNPPAEKVVTDAEITLDGKPDEGLWNEKRWFKTALPNQPDITATFTSHFGEKGAYFAFRAKDPAVYATSERRPYNNAGFQLYLTTDTSSVRNAASYEIIVDAAGNTMLRRYIRQTPGIYSYVEWPERFFAEVVTEGGAVNSGSCTGYTMELFMPWRMFEVEEQPEFLKTNVAFVRSLSANKDEGRLYYNIGQNERNANWTNTQNWYTFDTNGLIASDVNKTVSAGGTIETADYVLGGEDFPITVKPDAGQYLKSLVVNGVECVNYLHYDYAAGVATYTQTAASGEQNIVAEFEALPAARTVTGTVTAETPLPNNNFALAQLYAVKNGSITQIPVASDGTFTTQLPATDMRLVATAPNYLPNSVTVATTDTTTTVELKTSPFGNQDNVGFASFNPNSWDVSRYLTDGIVTATPVTVSRPYEQMYFTDIYDDSILISARIRMTRYNADIRNGFTFRNAEGHRVFFALAWGATTQSVCVQGVGLTADDSSWTWKGLTPQIYNNLQFETDGMPFAVQYTNGKFNIWLNGEQIVSNYSAFAGASTYLTGDLAVGLESWVKGGDFFDVSVKTGAEADAGIPTTGLKPAITTVGSGTVTVDQPTFTAGEDVTLRFVPATGHYLASVLVNGVERIADVESNSLTVTAKASLTVRATFKEISTDMLTYSGIASLSKDGATTPGDGVTVTLYNSVYNETTTADEEGRFSFQVPAGTYRLTASKNGYFDFETVVTFNDDDSIEITLNGDFAELTTFTPSAVDLSHMNDADHAISFTGGNAAARIKLTAAQKNAKRFAVFTTIRVNAVHGTEWGDNFGILMAGEDAGGQNRYGLSFLYRTLNDPTQASFIKQQWANVNVLSTIPDWITEKLWKDGASGAGLEVMMIRDYDSLDLYAKKDNEWVYLCSTYIPADAVNDVRLWSNGKSTYYNTSIGEIPDIAVSKNTVEHATVTVDPVAYGDDLVIRVSVENDYRLESLTVNGKPYAEYTGATVEDGVITIPGWKTFNADIVATVGEIPQEYTYSGSVSLHKDGETTPGNGVTVTLQDTGMYKETRELGAGGTFSFNAYAGTYTLTAELDGYIAYEQEVTVSGNVTDAAITLEWKFAYIVPHDNGQVRGSADLSKMNDSDHAISMSRGTNEINVELSLTEAQKKSKKLAVYATIKADKVAGSWNDNFGISMVGTVNANRTGLTFLYGDLNTITSQTYIKQQWAGVDAMSGIPQWVSTAIKGSGLSVLYIRNGMKLHLYAKQNDAYVYLCSTDVREDGDNVVRLWQCGYSTYNNISVTTELPSVTVTKNDPDHATVTVDPLVLGDSLVVRMTPETDYMVKTVTVNSKAYTEYTGATLADNVLTIPNWTALTADVSITLIDVRPVDFIMQLKMRKLGVNGNEAFDAPIGTVVTLTETGKEATTVTLTEAGRLTLSQVLLGTEFTAAIEGYQPFAVTIAEPYTQSFTAEYDIVDLTPYPGQSTNLKEFLTYYDVSELNGGTLERNKTGGEWKIILMNVDVAAGQNFEMSGIFKDTATKSAITRYGFQIGGNENGSASKDDYTEFMLEYNNGWGIAFGGEWSNSGRTARKALSAKELALLTGNGLKLVCGRTGSTVWFETRYEEDGKEVVGTHIERTCTGLTAGDIRLGFRFYHLAKVTGIDYTVYTTNPSVNVTKNETEHATVTVTPLVLGESLVVTVAPESGWLLNGITVNGKAYTQYTGATLADNVLTIPCWKALTADVQVEVVDVRYVDLAMDLKLHKFNVNGNQPFAAPVDTVVHFSGMEQEFDVTVTEAGRLEKTNVLMGTYTATIEGYDPFDVTVAETSGTATATAEYTVANLVDLTPYTGQNTDLKGHLASYDISGLNSGTLTRTTGSNWRIVLLNGYHFAAGEDFEMSATFKAPASPAQWHRIGFLIARNENGSASSDEYTEPLLEYNGTNWGIVFGQNGRGRTELTGDSLAALHSDDGVTIACGRTGTVIWLETRINGETAQRTSYDFAGKGAADSVRIGFRFWVADVTLTDIQVKTADQLTNP